ncbi:MAG TPA: sigma-70 family RNA polymerase sigma factor [Nocardioidaceae bacterium]|nr:sigma-70 family RNA polymerase sigma factor [Nocardioidaceae bacterium]
MSEARPGRHDVMADELDPDDAIAGVFRAEWGRLVAGLIGWCGDWDLAEECAQEAFAAAVRSWPSDGTPDRPLAWLTTVARNRARDRIRRRTTEAAKLALLVATPEEEPMVLPEITDDRLRLIFTCCHPALPMPARIALTLRTLCGLTSAEIARAFLVTEPTMEKRLVRARAKIRNAGIPYRVPPPELLPERLSGVLAVLYLLFNEGYAPSSGDSVVRVDVTLESIRLTRMLRELMPDEDEVVGLLALMLLTDARRPARVRDGQVVLLGEQDRSRWSTAAIDEGAALLSGLTDAVGPYQVQARVALIHDRASSSEDTDWAAIANLYRLLPSTPITELNRAVAVAMVDGPRAGLDLIEPLAADLAAYYLYFATRADFEARLGLAEAAGADLDRAIELAPTSPERHLLQERRAALA